MPECKTGPWREKENPNLGFKTALVFFFLKKKLGRKKKPWFF